MSEILILEIPTPDGRTFVCAAASWPKAMAEVHRRKGDGRSRVVHWVGCDTHSPQIKDEYRA